MKKRAWKNRAASVLCLLAIAAAVFLAVPGQAEAKGKELTVAKKSYMDLTSGGKRDRVSVIEGLEVQNFTSGKDSVLSATSSNSSVLKVRKDADVNAYMMYPRKSGKAKVTLTIKKANGKTKKLSSTVMVQKWKTPVKTFKIGNTSLANRFKKGSKIFAQISQYPSDDPRSSYTGKLQIQAAKGWKLVGIQKEHYNWSTGKYKRSALKNGRNYKFVADDTVILTFKDTKTKFIRKCEFAMQ